MTMAYPRLLFLLGLILPALTAPTNFAIRKHGQTIEREISTFDVRLVVPRSTITGDNTSPKKHQTARLSRRTNSGGGGGGEGQQWRQEFVRRLRQLREEYQQQRQERQEQTPESTRWARPEPSGADRGDQAARQWRIEELRRQIEEQRPEWRRSRLELAGQEERQAAEMAPRDAVQQRREMLRAEGELEFLLGMPRIEGTPQEYIRVPIEVARRFHDCASVLYKAENVLTFEEHQVCLEWAHSPDRTVEDIFSELQKANEAKASQNKPTHGDDQNMSIVTQAGQLAHRAGDRLKKTGNSLLKSVGHALGEAQSGGSRPIQSASPGMLPANALPRGVMAP